MELSDYAAQAMNTEASAEDTPAIRVRHAEMGLFTEAAEIMDALKKFFYYGKAVDRQNLLEEIGDVAWYVAIPVNHLELTFADFSPRNHLVSAELSEEDALMLLARRLMQQAAMFSRYAVDLEREGRFDRTSVVSLLGNMIGLLRAMCDILDAEFEEVLAGNIAKLKARYPNKFTQEAALTRDTVAEMAALEGELAGAAG